MDGGELTISATDFKAKCLDLFDQLAARKLKRIVVLKRGRPVAVLSPPPSPRDAADTLFGCMRGTVAAPKGFDFTRPVLDVPLNAQKGRIHEQMSAILLDTCAVIFVANGDAIAETARRAIREAAIGEGVLVSPVSAWEIGMLAAKRRVEFRPDPKSWFLEFLGQSGVRIAPLSPEGAIDASSLKEPLPGDPADRLLVSTARHLDVPIVTRDRAILAYGRTGWVKSIAC